MSGNLQAALALHRKGKLREAARIYQRILETQPNEVNSLHLLGTIRLVEGDAPGAAALIGRALELKPDYAEAQLNMGSVYRALGRLREALVCYDNALTLRADLIDAHYNRGVVLHEIGELDAALDSYRMATVLKADHAEALSNAALIFLLRGDFANGWPLYEWRLATSQYLSSHPQPLPGKRWSGTESITGSRVLVHCEQGLGDAIQFARYLPQLAEHADIVVMASPSLHRLFASIPGVTTVIDDWHGQRFDFHVALLSLPGIFGTTIDNIPAGHSAYLDADPNLQSAWRERLATPGVTEQTLKVGLMWSGGRATPIKGRSMPLTALRELIELPVDFISLQKEISDGDAALLSELPRLRHFGAAQTDFADAAAIISLVDLVISVDTSIAHLAAALGKETWIALPKVADWRWLEGRDDSPWYPAVRLFRQERAGDWMTVVAALKARLATRLETPHAT